MPQTWSILFSCPEVTAILPDQNMMGPYRALAQLSFQALEKGDYTSVAKLARALERTWDRGESSQRVTGKPHNQPREGCQLKMPDLNSDRKAFLAYLDKLKEAGAI
jgi:hypothetical protein